MTQNTKRRALLLALVLIPAIALTLAGCATADVVCDMRTDFAIEAPEAQEGRVTIRWEYGQDAYLPAGVYGTTECFGLGDARFCLIRMRGSAASYRNVCGIARLRHEEKHAMGATHEPVR